MKNKKILFITYDGLFDQLGQSQIIPYLISLKKEFDIHILSFEKQKNLDQSKINFIKKNFNWQYGIFIKSNLKIIKVFDYIKIFFMSLYLINKKQISICHGRGFIPSFIIYLIRNFINVKFIYDLRGFWPDERIDNKQLDLKKIIDLKIYNLLKKLEKKMIASSDHTVVLTEKAKEIVKEYNQKITVIPCATDFSFFYNKKVITEHNQNIKELLNNYKNIFCYLGSTKGAYMYDAILRYFKLIITLKKNSLLLIITNDVQYSEKILSSYKFKLIKNNVKIISLERNKIPYYLNICKAMIVFIQNSYARKAMSPVKFSEALASNLPVIINNNIGDLDSHISKLKIGLSIDINNIKTIKNSIKNIDKLSNKYYLRDKAHEIYDLKNAIKKYTYIYNLL